MDPLSAFGLAVNILSVVDISKSFLETLGQVKDAGSSAATRDIVSISRSLQASNAKIASQSWAENDDEAFKNLVEECQKLSKELVRLAEELSVRSSSKLVAKLKVAALTVWSHSRIEEKKARLETIRGQIMFDIVVPTARRVHEIPDMAAIDTQTRSLLEEIKAGHNANSAMEKRLRIFHEEYAAVQDERHTELVSLLRDMPDVRPQPPTSTKRDENPKSKGLVLDSLLDSLYFPQESDRFHNINPAHKGTFEWIYRQPPTGANKATWTNFREWMQHGSGIYWISGKAGSGKSTLMKLLRTDARTRSSLRDWGASSRLLVLSFYFWNPGTPLQKSLEGLLRSVVFQALEECPELVEKIFDAGLLRRIDKHHSPTIPELKQAFSCLTAPGLTDSSGAPIRIGLLIDGLDEFDAGTTSFTELAALFTAAAQSPSFKAVLSSRPENAFEEAFINCSKLRLHYLTHSDVVKYVNENLRNHPRMLQLISRAPEESANLVEEIVEAAQGVFLWVKVVVRSLLEGFQNHDEIGALTERLRELPTDLEDLFRVMLDRVPQRYKSTMSKTFQLIRGISELQSKDQPCMDGTDKWPLTALTLKFALVEPKAVLQAQIGEFTIKRAFEEIRSIEAQIRICCSGLIELRASTEQAHPDPPMEPAPESKNKFRSAAMDNWNDWYDPEVQFIHRSVKEYLSKEDVWDEILDLEKFNVEAAIFQSLVMQAKCGSYGSRKSSSSKGVPWDIVATALEIARTLEIECGTDQLDMMNALETALTTRCGLTSSHSLSVTVCGSTSEPDFGMEAVNLFTNRVDRFSIMLARQQQLLSG
ncbi:hypothetical protein CGCF415_v002345 [Colletotrichum fructicola]|uniref:Small s protein n=1 Tax=Colletotrichum fructicola (strain Nara gc5) TaxID=1213859 RepID=L2GCX0_COLFN|nr:Vegetative incompatibility protein HET-E-1 [Colletotrichum fructicola]KAF4902496.1 hypothetical protein CGCFRS4_v002181 [Colletotrichum fructicola]KAF4914445.1 hypothetical protein CGCF415_v002345 [Colletotrichum fructicola]KAF4940908.1 hypothetical protein CGCF245_v002313 [Colletotrichum fructicola]KAF5504101.1 hypothetical protein CGCF413_v005894 [Colletotrichum fructicola]